MNVADVKIRIKRQFGDESLVQVTDEDILRWINDAQRDIIMQNEGTLESLELQDLVQGQDEYSLPEDLMILRVVRIRMDSTQPYQVIQWLSLSSFDELISGWDGSSFESRPEFYTVYDGNLYLFPKPATAMSQGLKIIYSQKPTDVTSDADPISLPVIYHNAIVKYCISQAYEMDEDWEGAVAKAQQYQTDVNTNVNRENWGARQTYPVITVREEDMY